MKRRCRRPPTLLDSIRRANQRETRLFGRNLTWTNHLKRMAPETDPEGNRYHNNDFHRSLSDGMLYHCPGPPSPKNIASLRVQAARDARRYLSLREAAALIPCSAVYLCYCEDGKRRMHPAIWLAYRHNIKVWVRQGKVAHPAPPAALELNRLHTDYNLPSAYPIHELIWLNGQTWASWLNGTTPMPVAYLIALQLRLLAPPKIPGEDRKERNNITELYTLGLDSHV